MNIDDIFLMAMNWKNGTIYIEFKFIKIYVVIECQIVKYPKQQCLISFASALKAKRKLVLNLFKPCLIFQRVTKLMITEYIDRLGAVSNEICEKEGKKTINSDHFYKALKVSHFSPFSSFKWMKLSLPLKVQRNP